MNAPLPEWAQTAEGRRARLAAQQPQAVVEPKAVEQTYALTKFADANDTNGTLVHPTWGGLKAFYVDPPKGRTKKQTLLVRAGVFHGNSREATAKREDGLSSEPLNCSMLQVESDGRSGRLTVDEARARFEQAGVRGIVHTSASHTPENPRWRALLPLSAPVTDRAKHQRLVSVANGIVGGVLDAESWHWSRGFFAGKVELREVKDASGNVVKDANGKTQWAPAAPYECFAVEGEFIDKVDVTPIESKTPVAAPRTTSGTRKAIGKPVVPNAVTQYMIDNGWVKRIDGDMLHVFCPWAESRAVGDAGEAGFHEDGDESSSTWAQANEAPGVYGNYICLHRCNGHPDRGTSAFLKATGAQAIVDQLAEEARAATAAEFDIIESTPEQQVADREQQLRNGADADEVAAYLRTLPRDVVLKRWVFLTARMQQADVHKVRDEVHRLSGLGVRDLNAALKADKEQATGARRESKLAAAIGGRMVVTLDATRHAQMAAQVEAEIAQRVPPEQYAVFAGMPSRVVTRALPFMHAIDDPEGKPPVVPTIEQLGGAGLAALAEQVAVVVDESDDGKRRAVALPDKLREQLVTMADRTAPVVYGMVTHPAVTRDGTIVSTDGLHGGLYFANAALDGARAYSQAEAVAAWGRLHAAFLAGFEFASALDADVALAALFTGVQRKLLDQAPGIAAMAASQSSGKTTVMRRLHVMLTGCDLPVQTFSDSEEEVRKALLSSLLAAPAMVVFDNIPDGLTFNGGPLSAAMTSATFQQRLLGGSTNVTAPTNVLFGLTGNNLKLGADEVTRWMVTRLAPKGARPQGRQFKHPDVIGHALAIRHGVLRDVVGIIAGYIKSGASVPGGVRFQQWDRAVRQPLVWAGAADVAECFTRNEVLSDDLQGVEMLHHALIELFGEGVEFTATKVVTEIGGVGFDGRSDDEAPAVRARIALESLKAKDVRSERSVGRALAAALSRSSPAGVLRSRTRDGRTRLWVEGALA